MPSKAEKIEMKILKLPVAEQEAVREYFRKNPEKVWGEQKSLIKGFSDLPLFSAADEQMQKNLFEQ